MTVLKKAGAAVAYCASSGAFEPAQIDCATVRL
jgi:hypothetical protein